ncbi:MAG: hypothetical protein JWR42_539 [Marmoricola sp.]|nr:hypothetical protein [Marmoricola sp.]
MRPTRFDRVEVVVPARDEEQHLADCLESVLAAARLAGRVQGCDVGVTVVLDSCTDRSAEVVATFPGVRSLVVRDGVVGRARRRGLVGLDRGVATWVACTDADTVVPRRWLSTQLALAALGPDLLVGTVTPDPRDVSPGDLLAWHALHPLGEGHPFVHGANLGFSLAAYDRVGGFAPLATGEDVDLVARMQAAGVPWRATDRTRVSTSGRWRGRAPEGFAGFLRELRLGALDTA